MIHKIQANSSGSKFIEVSDEHLKTIQKYSLFRNLVDSNGIIDEDLLDKLRLNIRSLLGNEENTSKELLDLCLDVITRSPLRGRSCLSSRTSPPKVSTSSSALPKIPGSSSKARKTSVRGVPPSKR